MLVARNCNVRSRNHSLNVEKPWPWAHVGSQNQRRACCYSRSWRRDFVGGGWGAHAIFTHRVVCENCVTATRMRVLNATLEPGRPLRHDRHRAPQTPPTPPRRARACACATCPSSSASPDRHRAPQTPPTPLRRARACATRQSDSASPRLPPCPHTLTMPPRREHKHDAPLSDNKTLTPTARSAQESPVQPRGARC